MKENIEVLIDENKIQEKIYELAQIINKEYAGEEITLVCILKGSVFFTCDLAKRLDLPVKIDFMVVSSYGSGTVSSGNVKIIKDLDEPIEGKNILIVEDIIDTGRTLSHLIEMLKGRKPKTLRICTLLNKKERREAKVDVDYIGFDIPDEFVIGYGLDHDQRYRNLPYIGVVKLSS